jgi:hypothetical protein
MPGLRLTGSAGVYAGVPPSYAASPTGATISSRAYGVGSAGPNAGPRTCGYGVTLAGALGTALLVYLWWSLPR